MTMPDPAPPPTAGPSPAAGRSRLPFAVALVVIIGIVVAVAVANGAFRGSGSGANGGSPSASTPGLVPPDQGVVAEGRVVPLRTAEVAFATGGRVMAVSVSPGHEYPAGAVLVELNPTAAQAELESSEAAEAAANAAVDQAAAAVRQAQANVDAARAAVDQAQAQRRVAAAARDQLPSGSSAAAERQADAEVAGAQAGVNAARAELDGARAALDAAEAARTGAQADLDRASSAVNAATIALDDYTLFAPIKGTVASVDVAVGDLVEPGQVVVRLGDLTDWRFEATDLSETSISRVVPGAPATVTVDGLPGEEIAGTVESVGGYGTESQGDIVFRVVVAPTGTVPDGLRWNMTVTMEIDATGS